MSNQKTNLVSRRKGKQRQLTRRCVHLLAEFSKNDSFYFRGETGVKSDLLWYE